MFDLVYLITFGIIGYILDKNKYPIAPFILAFVLGGIIEENLRRSIINADTFMNNFSNLGFGTVFVILVALLPIIYAVSHLLSERKMAKLE